MENLAEITLNELKTTTNPGKVLCGLWVELFSVRFTPVLLQQFHRLVRVYGKKRVLFATISVFDSYYTRKETITVDNPFSLIAHFAKDQLKTDFSNGFEKSSETLSEYTESYKDALKNKEKVELPESFEDANGRN